jgi:hypothetical protein
MKSVAELLVGFFKFYAYEFKCEKHVISMSHEESLIDREKYLEEL